MDRFGFVPAHYYMTLGIGVGIGAGTALGVAFGIPFGAQRTQGKTFDVFRPIQETEASINGFYGQETSIETKYYEL